MKTTCITHSADFDGKFCEAIARKFLPPDTTFIEWDFKDEPLPIPTEGMIYVMDLPVDKVFGFEFGPHTTVMQWPDALNRIIWIDHHKSSIDSHPHDLNGYRIDGVAACRLAWQWFDTLMRNTGSSDGFLASNVALAILATKQDFIDRKVSEPLAVRLAGEYDIWDKRDPRAELFQHGLRSRDLNGWWEGLLSDEATASVAEIENRLEQGSRFELLPNGNIKVPGLGERMVSKLLKGGEVIQFARANEYRDVITQQGFTVQFEGLTFLACNSHELDIRSQLFEAGIKPHHDALLGFTFTGKDWRVSMYRIDGKNADILRIAKEYGGGGHRGACGFHIISLLFVP